MMKQLFYSLCLLFFTACQSENQEGAEIGDKPINETEVTVSDTAQSVHLENEVTFQAETFHDNNIGWGYKILQDGEPYINQPHIPAIPGTKGFVSEEEALRTANLMVYKLENDIVPPSVTIDELDSLEISY